MKIGERVAATGGVGMLRSFIEGDMERLHRFASSVGDRIFVKDSASQMLELSSGSSGYIARGDLLLVGNDGV